MKRIALIAFLALTVTCAIAKPGRLPSPEEQRWAAFGPTALVQLISTPEKFDGKTVGTTGYLGIGPEESRLYMTKEDADYCTSENAIEVAFASNPTLSPAAPKGSIKAFNRQRVYLCGRFNAKDRQLRDIVRVVLSRQFYDGNRMFSEK